MAEKKYWKSLEELNQKPEIAELNNNEFDNEIPAEFFDSKNDSLQTNRRDFLKVMGFSLTAATVAAGCEIPIRKVAPYVFKPEDITPGVATWYASSYINGGDYCSILVKTREGRPIKIEGNSESKITKGGTSARVQASVLSLYDTARLRNPMVNGKNGFTNATFDEIDKAIGGKLTANPNANIRILTSTVISPSTKNVFAKFTEKYPNTKVYSYDAVSYDGMLMANSMSKGKNVIPDYDFSKAKVIVSIDADFLGTWISPIEYTKGYVSRRKVSKENADMSRHYQIESRLSLTGSNADYRMSVLPSELGIAALNLYDAITGGNSSAGSKLKDAATASRLMEAAEWLKKNRGESLVVSGCNDVNIQLVVNAINDALGNYGKTISLDSANMMRQGSDASVKTLLNELKGNQVNILMVYDCNPVYDHPMGNQLSEAMKNTEISVSFAGAMNETSVHCKYVCPDHHYLESWNDAEPKKGYYSLSQPTIANLFTTRQMQDSLLTWGGMNMTYHDFIMQSWNETNFTGVIDQSTAFNKALQIGLYQPENNNGIATAITAATADLMEAPAAGIISPEKDIISAAESILAMAKKTNGVEIQFYESIAIGDGRYADNPWLQELPDPVSKITWDNYLNVSPGWAAQNKLMHGDIVKLNANGKEVLLPVCIQPGQAFGSASVALGYGRTILGKGGEGIGIDVYPMLDASGDCINYMSSGATITKTGDNEKFAQTQTHFSLNDGLGQRRIVKETTLAEYKKDPLSGNEDRAEALAWEGTTFYPDYFGKKNGFNWGMSIDLNSCVGCGACVIACNAENNIPVVGKNEVKRAHEMHWMRIDRYYAGDQENPEVVFQPMLCQHCENAPCENVCPVGATNHSSEGFNQMAYNRCIGTRYCANNCPYKVRRFNWFDYGAADTFGTMNDPSGTEDLGLLEDLTRMVLNPDVTVRSRGVIEKCSFCVQRIQEAKLSAKKENRELKDGDFRVACQSSCPAEAITFGNNYDETSMLMHEIKDERTFGILEEFHWLPSVLYKTKVRNKDKADHKNEEALDIMNLFNE
ncbi:MAG: TAT-variant-translocated molybdopterin oxidoreductase [Chitinophagales bacterium]